MKIGLLARLMVAAVAVPGGQLAWAETNSWTSSSSGRWEDLTWSLSHRPTNSDSVAITNSPSKAVAVFPSTPIDFPATMTISNLTVSAPPGSTNTLLLNFSGTDHPLRALNDVNILDGGAIDNEFGALKVEGSMLLFDSTMVMQGGLLIATNTPNAFAASLQVVYSSLIQTGGEVQAALQLWGGNYSMSNGVFRGSMDLGDFPNASGHGDQAGGTNFGGINIHNGSYDLNNGAVFGKITGTEGGFGQVNGAVNGSIGVAGSLYASFSYSMEGGTNHLDAIGVGVNGGFSQSGGINILTNGISVSGYFDDYGPIGFGNYSLNSGMVSCSNIYAGLFGHFFQSGGTNKVTADVFVDAGGGFVLAGGTLQTSNTFLAGDYHRSPDIVFTSQFNQSSGTHIVADTLSASGNYNLSGGTLSAKDILLRSSSGSPFVIYGTNAAPVIINTGQFIANGTLRLVGSVQQLGVLRLTGDATFDFTQTPGELRFQNSSGALWTNIAVLTVTNWIGSTNGGGANRLVIGTDGGGITLVQSLCIRFANPAGLPPGIYNADVLATGEIVPASHVNSWTGPVSANWTDLNWSHGIRPTNNYSIFITNSGSKAVALQPSTPINFPGAMTIRDLTVDAPDGFINTLLLNFSGTNNPLQILENATIGKNGVLNLQHAAVSVGLALTINGGLLVEEGNVLIPGGSVYLSGGTATVSNSMTVVQTMLCTNAVFNQIGGTLAAYDVQLQSGGRYDLTNGAFRGGLDILGGSFKQSGGTAFFERIDTDNFGAAVTNGLQVFTGSYEMDDGVLGGELAVYNTGYFSQSNGSIRVSSFSDAGTFLQENGSNIATNSFSISGNFRQRAGTNIALADLSVSGPGTYLEGGLLQSSNTFVWLLTRFYQTGGLHLINGALTNQGGNYFLSGGTLSAPDILMSPIPNFPPATLAISNTAAPLIVNTGQFSLFGNVTLAGSIQQFGTLILAGDSVLDFTATPGRLKFLNSSAALWTNDATLTVSNWAGLPGGNGPNRLLIGNSINGLAATQLSQIRFINPAGFPAGTYFADMLATGEVVPTIHPHLLASKVGNSFILTWPPTFTLETSTNVQGPYLTVPGAVSPFTNLFTEPRRFFRLKQ